MIIDASDTGLYGDVKDLEEQNINVAVKKFGKIIITVRVNVLKNWKYIIP